MNLRNGLEQTLENIVQPSIKTSTETASFNESNPALDFVDAGYITSDETQTNWIILTAVSDSGELVTEVSIAFIPSGEIAYISDFEVGSAFRNEGVGSTVHTKIISILSQRSDITRIFEVPTNDAMERIVHKDGFTKLNEKPLSSWFVKSV